jgi:hypothetical protein
MKHLSENQREEKRKEEEERERRRLREEERRRRRREDGGVLPRNESPNNLITNPVEATITSAPGPVEATTTSAPGAVEATITSAPAEVDATITSAPSEVDATITSAPSSGDATTTSAPDSDSPSAAAAGAVDAPGVVAPAEDIERERGLLSAEDAQAFRVPAELGEDRETLAIVVAFDAALNAANLNALAPSLAHGWNIAGVEHCLHASELDAYLMALVELRRAAAAIVTTQFGTAEHFRALQAPDVRAAEDRDRPLRAATFIHGHATEADVILIPRLNFHAPAGLVNVSNTTGHFTIGAYYPRTGTVQHYDPLQTPIDDNMRQFYRQVVATLHVPGQQPFRAPRVYQRPADSFNQQTDGVNCGFYAALIGEMVLLRGHDQTYIPAFGLEQLQRERNRIVTFLRSPSWALC